MLGTLNSSGADYWLHEERHRSLSADDILDLAWQLEAAMEKELVLTQDSSKLLSDMLDDTYTELQPTSKDYCSRSSATECIESLVKQKVSVGEIWREFGNCVVRAFGSYTMDLFASTSDLDLSIDVEHGAAIVAKNKQKKLMILKKLTNCLRKIQKDGGHICNIQPVYGANVPVVKFLDRNNGLECDVSIENRDGVLKSQLLQFFSSLDLRFRKLCFVVKAWAKAQEINSSKDNTLNSLSLILLIAFHLQTRSPPILPPFAAFLEGLSLEADFAILPEVKRRITIYKDFGKKNGETIGRLFNSFLLQLVAVKDLWRKGLCASTYEGRWILSSKPNYMNVEDFTQRSQNAAKAVGEKGYTLIYSSLHAAVKQLKVPLKNMEHAKRLKHVFFEASVRQGKRPLQKPEKGRPAWKKNKATAPSAAKSRNFDWKEGKAELGEDEDDHLNFPLQPPHMLLDSSLRHASVAPYELQSTRRAMDITARGVNLRSMPSQHGLSRMQFTQRELETIARSQQEVGVSRYGLSRMQLTQRELETIARSQPLPYMNPSYPYLDDPRLVHTQLLYGQQIAASPYSLAPRDALHNRPLPIDQQYIHLQNRGPMYHYDRR